MTGNTITNLANSTVWVSGTSGRLGSEVAAQLRALGAHVLEADSRGEAPVDLTDAEQVAKSMRGADAVVHCAAIPNPVDASPAHLVFNNVVSCFHALEQAWNAGVRTAVIASSISIYGTAWSPEPLRFAEIPVTEHTPLEYVDPYALTKDFGEAAGRMYARRGMTVTELRFAWIISPEEARDAVRASDPAEGAANAWGWVATEDAARACIAALRPTGKHSGYETALVTSDDVLANVDSAELIERYLPDARRTRPIHGREALYDLSHTREVLGWRPRVSWRVGE